MKFKLRLLKKCRFYRGRGKLEFCFRYEEMCTNVRINMAFFLGRGGVLLPNENSRSIEVWWQALRSDVKNGSVIWQTLNVERILAQYERSEGAVIYFGAWKKYRLVLGS